MVHPALISAQQQTALPLGLMSPWRLQYQPYHSFSLEIFTTQTSMQRAQALRDASQGSSGPSSGISASRTWLQVLYSTRIKA